MGLFALTACSEDVYEDAEMQNEEAGSQYQTNSFNNQNSGQYAGYGPGGIGFWGINYISPWDVWFRGETVNGHSNLQPSYFFANGNMEDVTPYDIEVFAYAGLAYFDGDNNGVYEDPKLLQNTGNGFVAQIDNGNYPNLYANNQEVGNLVKTPVQIDVPAYPNPNHSFRYEDRLDHFPLPSPQGQPKYVPNAFDFAGTLTQDELDLLQDYGKIFFYEVNVYDKVTGAFIMSTMMHPYIGTLPTGSNPDPGWVPVTDQIGNQLQGNVPTLGGFDLYYFYSNIGGTQWNIANPFNSNLCDSREVVFDVPMPLHEVQIDPNFKITLGFSATGQTGWVNSALYLNVTGR